jgi:hypothetical protein
LSGFADDVEEISQRYMQEESGETVLHDGGAVEEVRSRVVGCGGLREVGLTEEI